MDDILTSSNEVGVGKGSLCLHEGPGMSGVEHIKHTISVHSNRFYGSFLGLLIGDGSGPPWWGWQLVSQGGWLGGSNIFIILITGLWNGKHHRYTAGTCTIVLIVLCGKPRMDSRWAGIPSSPI